MVAIRTLCSLERLVDMEETLVRKIYYHLLPNKHNLFHSH